MNAGELFRAGRLTEAVAAAIDDVKRHPLDTPRRVLLAELFCFQGELERADKQLDTLGRQDEKLAVGVSLLRQLIRAETSRRECLASGRLPDFLDGVPSLLQFPLKAIVALREGAVQEAAELLAQAEQDRPRRPGTIDGRPFDDFRDLDDLFSTFFEVLTSTGKYYWIPVQQTRVLEFYPPERPCDLLWRRARMVVQDGPEGDVYLPTTYAPLAASAAGGAQDASVDLFRLGRQTDWLGDEGQPVRGVGQRMFLAGDETPSILDVQSIQWEA